MRIDRIEASGFTCIEKLDLELPPLGLTVVTGENGNGKSSLIEMVAAAFWGRTLRGKPFWREGQKCFVAVTTDLARAERTVAPSGKKALTWAAVERWEEPAGVTTYGTASKAQEQLDELVPPMEVWRRCSVFTSDDAALFSTATDKTRKELLEHLLGIDRFDAALKRAVEDRRREEQAKLAVDQRLSRSLAVIEEKRRRLEDAFAFDPSDDLDLAADSWFRRRRLRIGLDSKERSLELVGRSIDGEERSLHALEREVAAHRKRHEQLAGGTCPLCEQLVPLERVEAIAREIAREEEMQVDEYDRVERRRELADARRRELRSEVDALRRRYEGEGRFLAAAEALAARAEQLAGAAAAIRKIDSEVKELDASIALDGLEQRRLGERLAMLRAVEQVLGMKGVRAHVLSGALRGLEVLANAKLERMHPSARLRLKPYTELKTKDAVADAISIEVEGTGAGWGYEANSGGERRRLDLALLLGLAELSAAATGSERGTLFVDEALDALDAKGVDAVSNLILEMAAERPVVVISHNEALLESLRPRATLRLHAEAREIKRRSAA